MIVLSFDTSLAACSAAVVDVSEDARVLSASRCEPGKGHAEILLGMISEVMSTAGAGFEDVDRQIVTIGPGSFTGVRVGLSAARGFRIAHNIPICGVSTLQAIAANASKSDAVDRKAPIAVIIDARRNQAYGQVFDAALKPLCAPSLLAVDELGRWIEPWKDMSLTLMGSGAGLITKTGNLMLKIEDYALPDAACFAMALRDTEPDQTPPDPLYLRKPDAKPQIIGPARV